jgi:hypothetical protein
MFGKMKNKKGWLKMAEAFISILLIGTLLAFAISEKSGVNEENYNRIHLQERNLLSKIQLNESIREEVLSLSSIPKESSESGFPSMLNSTVNEINSNGLECMYKICDTGEDCSLNSEPVKKELFGESIIIYSTKTTFNPRSLNLFCWEK